MIFENGIAIASRAFHRQKHANTIHIKCYLPQLNCKPHFHWGWSEKIYKNSPENSIVSQWVAVLCVVILIKCTAASWERTVWPYAVLSYGRNDWIDSMRFATNDRFHCVLSLERGHIECEQHWLALKTEWFDLNSLRNCKMGTGGAHI